jgi:hypothetical protein
LSLFILLSCGLEGRGWPWRVARLSRQQRSLRRMRQVLSWALARWPGPRSLAWARLAAFCEGGLFLPLYGRGCGHRRRCSPCPRARSARRRPVPRGIPRMRAAVRSCTLPGSGGHKISPSGPAITCNSSRAGVACRSRTGSPRRGGRWESTCDRSRRSRTRRWSPPAAPCAAWGSGPPAGPRSW